MSRLRWFPDDAWGYLCLALSIPLACLEGVLAGVECVVPAVGWLRVPVRALWSWLWRRVYP